VTTEERFERIEHVTAGLAEQWRKEHEEDRQLWRDTQRQIENTQRQLDLFIAESRASDERLKRRIEELGEEFRAEDARLRETDRRLQERIDSLVSAIGESIAADERMKQRLEELAEEARAEDKRLRESIQEVDRSLKERIESFLRDGRA